MKLTDPNTGLTATQVEESRKQHGTEYACAFNPIIAVPLNKDNGDGQSGKMDSRKVLVSPASTLYL